MKIPVCFAARWPAHTILVLTILLVGAGFSVTVAADGEVRFNRDIRPIMSDTCFKCHGPATQKAGLRLDLREQAIKAGESGETPIVPGQPEKSEVIRRVFAAKPDEMMPPASSHKTLSADQKELFRRWIAQGAKYEKHWSFEPVKKFAPPQITAPGYTIRNPIDAFLAERLIREGLPMSAEADRETLIRRLSFALTGLPPAPAEVDAFVADVSPDAYERLVERYLASPRFGEEFARHWLDVARYADTHGLHLDNERQMWAYRDWVVAAFNHNQPFDRFTIEQVAGDLLPNPTQAQLVATGFNRCNVTTGEGGSIDAEWVFRNAVDRTSTTIETWLGLTGGCAVCHNHKFDPISQKEFYSLYSFFYSAADPPLDGNALLTAPSIKLSMPENERRLANLTAQLAAAQKELVDKSAAIVYVDPAAQQPPPPAADLEVVWLEDDFPAGAVVQSSGHPTTFVTVEQGGKVLSGKRSLRRSDKAFAQDYYDRGAAPLEVPAGAKIFAYVFIEAADAPKSIMLQYHKGGWLHRAVWGDINAIQFGAVSTFERVHMGPLPELGKWVRLEFPAEKLGFKPGDQITGLAFSQFAGTVYWDKSGVVGRSDPASDPRRSLLAWRKQQTGKDTPGAPGDVNQWLKEGPDKARKPEEEKKIRDFYLQTVNADVRPQLEPLAKKIADLQKARTDTENAIPGTTVFRDLPQPRDSFVMLRGQYDKPGEKVEPATPAVLPPLSKPDPTKRATRVELAKWLVSAEQPLTPRVAANRLWQQIYGVGLVKTSFDFGSQGETPSHPELLDWLAATYRENEWDTKQLVRILVTAHAFRQSSRITPEQLQRDPANRLYARGPRFRLDAEQVRDNALCVSGLMTAEMGGRGVRTYQPPNIWEPLGFTGSNTANYAQDHGAALYRRSVYCFLKRTAPPPFMVNFDGPSREAFCTRRERSNTPLQALQLLNDVQHFEAARSLAERMLVEGGGTPSERIAFAYRLLLARRPAAEETTIVSGLLASSLARFQQAPDAAKQVIRVGESPPKTGLAEPELAAYTLIANMLLNLDETLTRN